MLCTADKHCSQLCIAMLEMLLCGLCLCFLSYNVHAGLCWSHCMCCAWILAVSISDSRMLCTANKHCSQLCIAMLQMLLCGLCLCCLSYALHAGHSWSHYMCWAWILAASISDSRMLCTANKHCSQLCIAMLQMLLCGLCLCCLTYALHAALRHMFSKCLAVNISL